METKVIRAEKQKEIDTINFRRPIDSSSNKYFSYIEQ